MPIPSERALYDAADRVLSRSNDVTDQDIKWAVEFGLVEWSIDCDGYLPGPTGKYIELMDKFDPLPAELVTPEYKCVQCGEVMKVDEPLCSNECWDKWLAANRK